MQLHNVLHGHTNTHTQTHKHMPTAKARMCLWENFTQPSCIFIKCLCILALVSVSSVWKVTGYLRDHGYFLHKKKTQCSWPSSCVSYCCAPSRLCVFIISSEENCSVKNKALLHYMSENDHNITQWLKVQFISLSITVIWASCLLCICSCCHHGNLLIRFINSTTKPQKCVW